MKLDERIKAIRSIIDLSQSEFADKIGVNRTRIVSLEIGKARSLTEDEVEKICKIYNISINWLVLGEGDMFNSPSFVTNTLDNSPVLAWYNSMSDKEKTWFEIELMRKFPEFKDFVDKRKI